MERRPENLLLDDDGIWHRTGGFRHRALVSGGRTLEPAMDEVPRDHPARGVRARKYWRADDPPLHGNLSCEGRLQSDHHRGSNAFLGPPSSSPMARPGPQKTPPFPPPPPTPRSPLGKH